MGIYNVNTDIADGTSVILSCLLTWFSYKINTKKNIFHATVLLLL